MDGTQDQSNGKIQAKDLPKGGVRLSDLAKKRAENLRNNLSRRKEQARARQNNDQEPSSSER